MTQHQAAKCRWQYACPAFSSREREDEWQVGRGAWTRDTSKQGRCLQCNRSVVRVKRPKERRPAPGAPKRDV